MGGRRAHRLPPHLLLAGVAGLTGETAGPTYHTL